MELVDEYIAVRKKLEEERARLMLRVSQIDEALGNRRRESTVVVGRATLEELRKLESFGAHGLRFHLDYVEPNESFLTRALPDEEGPEL